MADIDDQTRIELEAAAFRGMNCLSKWYMAEAEVRGIEISYDEAREVIYGMPYGEWKGQHQAKASDEQMQKFEETKPLHADISGHN